MIAKPIITYLLSKDITLTVASRNNEIAEAMIGNHPGGTVVEWTSDDEKGLNKMVAGHNVTVSLLPWSHHLDVARCCLRHKKHMVTTSYVKPEMKALDTQSKEAGILILNELGLDPGIDHMSAMRIIDTVHKKGGKIEGFYSICGALPAPEAAGNPFRYKFSWSPKGVVMAGNNEGQFLRGGKIVKITPEDLFKNPMEIDFPNGSGLPGVPAGILEVYPNRDSLPYIDLYGIPETRTMVRGTFRHRGWCEILDSMKSVGLLSGESRDFSGKTYSEFMAIMTGEDSSINIKDKVAVRLNTTSGSLPLEAMEWLGLFEDSPMNRTIDTPFEIVSDLMTEKMMLGSDERDMVVLHHIFLASWPDGKKEVIKSSLVDFGSPPADTAISRTVALPAAIGVEMILDDRISSRGVQIPVIPEIYNPVLDRLEDMGIKMTEQYGLPESEWLETAKTTLG